MSEPADILQKVVLRLSARERVNRRNALSSSLRSFDAYDPDKWEKTAFYPKTGGYLVTERERIAEGKKSNNNRGVFEAEQEVCKFFASKGFRIEHISEPHGIKAPDARLVKGKHSLIKVNGILAEIKTTKSVGNLVKYGTEAVNKKGAEMMIYRLTDRNPALLDAIYELARKGVHGYYYHNGDKNYREF